MPARTSTESHPQLYGFPLILYSLLIRVAATLVGQFFLHVADRVLWTVENLTYWSIPTHRLAEFANAPQTPLVRPLSWWLFLPGLLWLRLIRKGVSVVLWFIGSEPVTPISMVYYVQTQRTNIQSIQQTGAQTIRKRREESAKKAGKIRGLWIKLQKLIHLKFLHFEEEEDIKVIRPRKSPSDEKKEESSGEETELTLAELLEKYTNMEDDEVNDPDYVPDEEESSTEDSSEDEDVNADALAKALLEESQELLNKSFICETPKLPIGGNYPRSKTPPIRDYSNTHHPSGSLQSEDRAKYTFPISSQYPNPESENDSIGSETKVQNGTSVDRQKGSTPKRNNHKNRANHANRWNFKENHVRKTPVITVSGTNNSGRNFFNANDAPKHTTSSGTSSPNKTTQSKELKKKDSDQNQEIF